MLSSRRPSPPYSRPARAALRGLAAGLVPAVVCAGGAAYADEPVGWEPVSSVSGLQFFLVLLIIPVALGIVISAVVALPSIIRGASYEDGEIWGGDDEWFGGPKGGTGKDLAQGGKGPAKAELEAAGEQGGAGARY